MTVASLIRIMSKKSSAPSPDLGKRKPSRWLPATLAVAAIGGVILLLRKNKLGQAIHTQYLLFAGMIGSMAAVLFMLFRFIRFLIRLYP